MVTLYYRDNVSDKVYQVSVDPTEGGYNVNFAYGRRGSTMNTGVKNSSPLPKDAADRMAEKLIREKMAKGYTPGENGVAYSNTSREERSTGIFPMLLIPISEEEMEHYIKDISWVMQAKYDGRRMLISKMYDVVEAINRNGLLINAPQGILDEIAQIPGNFVIDGECIGDKYYVFDMVSNYPLGERLNELVSKLANCYGRYVIWAPSYFSSMEKSFQAASMKANGQEGVVFKRLSAPYTMGRTSVALKCKFTATANVRVIGVNTQRSVAMCLQDGTPCGNVSVPANKEIPAINDIIEVRYLYAMPNSNALYQPFYSRLRDDVWSADSITDLKYKKEED